MIPRLFYPAPFALCLHLDWVIGKFHQIVFRSLLQSITQTMRDGDRTVYLQSKLYTRM